MTTGHRPNRRDVALGLAALPLGLAACGADTRKRVAVIGGGIVGASIAYHLSKAGAAVTLLERHTLATRSSRGTFAWLNASWAKQPRPYHALNQAGIAGWRALQDALDIPVRWGGSIEWFDDAARQDRLAEQIAEQAEWGEPARMVERADLDAMEPGVNFGGAARAALSGRDGALDPVLATRMLTDAATRLGCTVMTACEVTGASDQGDHVRLETGRGPVAVDRYVLATGADPDAIQALAGQRVPQRSTPGVIVITEPMPRLLERILVAPGVHIHQRADGRVVLGEQDGPPDTPDHAERLAGRPNRFPTEGIAGMHADQLLALAETSVPGIGSARVEDVFIGWRPLPLDGHPVLGPTASHPASYVAITHSGVTLAPIIGQHVATEIMTGASVPALEPYRPDRRFARVRRY